MTSFGSEPASTKRLGNFIRENIDQIIVEWERFAKTQQPAAEEMSSVDLRDHAKLILLEIATDIETYQSASAQIRKSHGDDGIDLDSSASAHGTMRQGSGFTLLQLTAEYRAVRASVLRLWLESVNTLDEDLVNDMLRFNEAIDAALAESVVTYAQESTRIQDMFLAMLGHDLRSPLQAVLNIGVILEHPGMTQASSARLGRAVLQSARTMSTMVNDLLEFARTQFGGSIPIRTQPADLADICTAAIADTATAQPKARIHFARDGQLTGDFDFARLQQVISNLLNNAVQYSGTHAEVDVRAGEARDGNVFVEVQNFGEFIPAASLEAIFKPLVQLPNEGEENTGRPATSLGLGLYIARNITEAHGGRIDVESSTKGGTIFRIEIPRRMQDNANCE